MIRYGRWNLWDVPWEENNVIPWEGMTASVQEVNLALEATGSALLALDATASVPLTLDTRRSASKDL